MKKIALAVAATAAISTAAPVVAQETPADPFVSSQALLGLTGLAVVGGVATVVVIAASSNSSDGT